MEIRYAPDPAGYRRMNTEELRKTFLMDNLFNPGKIELVYSSVDRSITGGAYPAEQPLKLEATKKEMAARFFTERRELGIINTGGSGTVKVNDKSYQMDHMDCLYVGKGEKEIIFSSKNPGDAAVFYLSSYPAHTEYPDAQMKLSETVPVKLGSEQEANKRTIYKYIFNNGIKSCQLVMGYTHLDEGSVWNTMPVHTHIRRSEIYFYFDINENGRVFHLLGEPGETRHIIVNNRQAVLSPSFSIHSGVGTQNYSFIWSMGGENQEFDDMDWVAMKDLA